MPKVGLKEQLMQAQDQIARLKSDLESSAKDYQRDRQVLRESEDSLQRKRDDLSRDLKAFEEKEREFRKRARHEKIGEALAVLMEEFGTGIFEGQLRRMREHGPFWGGWGS